MWKDSLPNCAANVLEINIDPVRACSCKGLWEVRGLVVNGSRKTKFRNQEVAFAWTASNTDGPCAPNFSQLPHKRADCACRCGHNDSVSFFRFTDRPEARICREARHTENTEICGHGRNLGIHFSYAIAFTYELCLPTGLSKYHVSWLVVGMTRSLHNTHALTRHHVPDSRGFGIRLSIVHSSAHVRVERQKASLKEKLPIPWVREGNFAECEISWP